jgi:Fic family protein
MIAFDHLYCSMFKPHFTITNNLLTYVSRIEAAKALIDNAALVPAWEAKFRDDALNRTVHYGTKIEGNDLTEEQAAQIVQLPIRDIQDTRLAAQQAGIVARERDIQEVINYRQVLEWINNWQDYIADPKALNDGTLKQLHRLTMQRLIEPQYIGEFRDKQVVVRSALDSSVVFRPPVFVEIPYLVDEFFTWLSSPQTQILHTIFKAAITHYQIVYIHPFIEGNGRTARAMATLVLYTSGYDFKRFFSLEKYFDDDVTQYYSALQSVQQQNDLTYWIEYFCYGLAIEIDKVKQQVLKLSKDTKLKQELGGQQVALTERQIVLLELFQRQEEVTSADAQEVLPNISVDTILRDIKDLVTKGVIEKRGVTKGVTYRLHK